MGFSFCFSSASDGFLKFVIVELVKGTAGVLGAEAVCDCAGEQPAMSNGTQISPAHAQIRLIGFISQHSTLANDF
jgi:hypothetical protein